MEVVRPYSGESRESADLADHISMRHERQFCFIHLFNAIPWVRWRGTISAISWWRTSPARLSMLVLSA